MFFSFLDCFVSRPSFLTNSSDLVFRDALRRKSAPAFVNSSSSSSSSMSAAAAAAEKVLGLAAEATSAQQTSEASDPNTMFYITLNIEGVDEEEEEEEEEEEGGERREIDSVQHVGSVERVESGPNLRPWRKKKKKLFPS